MVGRQAGVAHGLAVLCLGASTVLTPHACGVQAGVCLPLIAPPGPPSACRPGHVGLDYKVRGVTVNPGKNEERTPTLLYTRSAQDEPILNNMSPKLQWLESMPDVVNGILARLLGPGFEAPPGSAFLKIAFEDIAKAEAEFAECPNGPTKDNVRTPACLHACNISLMVPPPVCGRLRRHARWLRQPWALGRRGPAAASAPPPPPLAPVSPPILASAQLAAACP